MRPPLHRWTAVALAGLALTLGAQSALADPAPTAKYCAVDTELKITPAAAAAALNVNVPDLPDTITLPLEVTGTSATMYRKTLSERGNSQGKGNQGDGTNLILIGSESTASETFEDVERRGAGGGPYVLDLDMEDFVGESNDSTTTNGPNPRSGFEPVGTVNLGDAEQIHVYILDGADWVLMNIEHTCD